MAITKQAQQITSECLRSCQYCGGTGTVADDREVGRRLREIRNLRKISIKEVAFSMKVSSPYICDLELGRRHWSGERIMRYLEIVMVDLENN